MRLDHLLFQERTFSLGQRWPGEDQAPLFPFPFSLSQKRSGLSFAGGIAQVARAMALQAIGLGFESPYLQAAAPSIPGQDSQVNRDDNDGRPSGFPVRASSFGRRIFDTGARALRRRRASDVAADRRGLLQRSSDTGKGRWVIWQAGKGLRWMPWSCLARKAVVSCEKPRVGANILRSADGRMG